MPQLALSRIGFVAMAAVTALIPLGVAPAAAAPSPDWRLVGHHQHACFDANVHDAWIGVFIRGTWTQPITVDMKRLPAGATYTTSYTPIAAGTSKGNRTLAYADVHLADSTPVGKYEVTLWATDGTAHDHVRAQLAVTTDCGY
jgi:hypothetical protein